MDYSLKPLNHSDIPNVLEKASLFGGSLQQAASLDTTSSPFERMDVTPDGKITVKVPKGFLLDPERPVHFFLSYRNVSFLLYPGSYSIMGTVLTGELPKEVRALELRSTDRFIFSTDTRISATLYRIEKRPSPPEINASLVDVSIQGLGITLSGLEEDALKENDHLWLKVINDEKLERPVFARVVYIISRTFKDVTEFKAGIALDESIPENLLHELLEKSCLVLKA